MSDKTAQEFSEYWLAGGNASVEESEHYLTVLSAEYLRLAAKMAEPTDDKYWRCPHCGAYWGAIHATYCVGAIDDDVTGSIRETTWDTLHRTQDGGYWIPPVYEQMTREVDEHLAGEEPRPLRTESERTYIDREREQGAKVAAACAVNNGGRG